MSKRLELGTAFGCVVIAACAIGLAACAEQPVEPAVNDDSASADEIVQTEATSQWPAVGTVSDYFGYRCTASLVADNVILLPAFCLRETFEQPEGRFEVLRDGRTYSYPTGDRSWSVTRPSKGENVALLRLAERVPSAVARPLALAEALPTAGAPLSVILFDVTQDTSAGEDEGIHYRAGEKYRVDTTWDELPTIGNRGRDGAPLIDTRAGRIVSMLTAIEPGDPFEDTHMWMPDYKLGQLIANLRK